MADKNKKFRILFAGGGSAGHIIPALVVLKKFAQIYPKSKFLYVSEKSALSQKIVRDFKKSSNIKMDFKQISAGKLHRYLTWDLLGMPFRVLLGIWQSLILIKDFRPQAVFLKGGYVGVPIAVAAVIFRVPIILHETDASFGLANRLIIPFARKVATSFPKDLGKKFIHTGNPIREEFFKPKKSQNNLFTILVFGGSLGAHKINNLVSEIIPQITQKNKLIHITGANDFARLSNLKSANYNPIEFTSEIISLMGKSDLVISRSGGSIFEIAALAKPAILIPLSAQGSRGDQIENAEIFKKTKSAIVLPEDTLTSVKLLNQINRVIDDKALRQNLSDNIKQFAKKDAAEKIVAIIVNVIPANRIANDE